jgi:dTDP-glucose 4,6-dehydratase
MKILVTGGAGFIGSWFVRSLLAGEYPGTERVQVTVVDKLTYAGSPGNLPIGHPRLTFVRADICFKRRLREIVGGHDAVVHMAAETHVDRSIADASSFVRTNVTGTQNVLESCRQAGVERVVCVSTDEVYGSISSGAWSEDDALAPNSPYAASKAAADLVARAYHRTHGLPVMVTRCSNNYGPRQYPEKMIPLFITRLLAGDQVPLYGNGRNIREWLHVSDHCRAIHTVLEKGKAGETYNIGSGTALTNLELTRKLVRLCEARWDQVTFVTDRKGHDSRYAVDDSKIRDELGYRPRVEFDKGLTELVDWHRANRQRDDAH